MNSPCRYHNTSLHEAVLRNETVEAIELLLTSGADVNARNFSGQTPLDFAIFQNNEAIVQTLIQHGSFVNCINRCEQLPGSDTACVRCKRAHKKTSLHRAVINNKSAKIVEILLRNGAEVNARDYGGEAPLDLAVSNNNVAIVRLLIEHGALVNGKDRSQQKPLHRAVVNANAKEIVELLIKNGARVNTGNSESKTPLHLAASNNNVDIARILIKHGASIDRRDGAQKTPLHDAVMSNQAVKVVQLLLSSGADVNAKNYYGDTPLHSAVDNENLSAVRLLLEYDASVDIKGEYRQTPLHRAVSNNISAEIVDLLLSNGADVNVKDYLGYRPIHHRYGRVTDNRKRIMKMLLENGAYVNARGYQKEPALFYAFLKFVTDSLITPNNDSFMIEELLKYSADINHPDVLRLALQGLRTNKPWIFFFQQHLVKINGATLPLHADYKPYVDERDNQSYHNECLKEVEKLKSTFIDNRKSLYDFLHMHPTPRGAYANHEKLQQLVASENLNEQFPKYSDIIFASYREAVTRKSLLKPAKAAFYELIRFRLTDSIDKILAYLSDADLINIIESNEEKPGNYNRNKKMDK